MFHLGGVWWLVLLAALVSGCATEGTRADERGPIVRIGYSPDGRVLAVARRGSNRVTLLDAATLAVRGELGSVAAREDSHRAVVSLGFSGDGRRLVATGIDDTVIVWDMASGREVFHPAALRGARQAALSPDGKLVAVAGPGHDASVWRVPQGDRMAELKGHFDDVTAIAFSHRGDLIATGGADRTVRLWSLPANTSVTLPAWHRAAVTEVVFSPDDELLAVSGGYLNLWRVAERRLIGHALEPPQAASVPPEAQALVTLLMIVASARSIQLGGGPLGMPPVGGFASPEAASADMQIAFSSDGSLLAVLRRASTEWGKGEVLIAEVAGQRVTRIPCECFAIAFRPGTRAIATAGDKVQLWDPDHGDLLAPNVPKTP
jgi:WD40 repeat protein